MQNQLEQIVLNDDQYLQQSQLIISKQLIHLTKCKSSVNFSLTNVLKFEIKSIH